MPLLYILAPSDVIWIIIYCKISATYECTNKQTRALAYGLKQWDIIAFLIFNFILIVVMWTT